MKNTTAKPPVIFHTHGERGQLVPASPNTMRRFRTLATKFKAWQRAKDRVSARIEAVGYDAVFNTDGFRGQDGHGETFQIYHNKMVKWGLLTCKPVDLDGATYPDEKAMLQLVKSLNM